MDVSALAQQVKNELTTWAASDAGEPYDAPAWWERIFRALDTMRDFPETTADQVSRAFSSLFVGMIEFGPMTWEQMIAAAPSLVDLRKAVNELRDRIRTPPSEGQSGITLD